MKQMIELESKIQVLEKKNEKVAVETVNTYEDKIKKKDTAAKEEMKDINTRLAELKENLDKLQSVGKEKLRYELSLKSMQQDCESLEKIIQEEKYRIEISQARMKKNMEVDFQARLKEFKETAKNDAEKNVQEIERQIHAENQ